MVQWIAGVGVLVALVVGYLTLASMENWPPFSGPSSAPTVELPQSPELPAPEIPSVPPLDTPVLPTSTSVPSLTKTPTSPTATSTLPTSIETPIADSLVAWYRAEGNADDEIGDNHGDIIIGTRFAEGQIGQAFALDGVAGHVSIPDSRDLSITGSLTLEAWIKFNTLRSHQNVINKYSAFNDQRSYSIVVLEDRTVQFGVHQEGNGLGPTRAIATVDPIIEPGKFTHLVGTFDQKSQDMRVYVDGVEVPSAFLPPHLAEVDRIFDGSSPVRIGTLIGIQRNFINHVDGLIDEVKIYDRALTAEEVMASYQSGMGK